MTARTPVTAWCSRCHSWDNPAAHDTTACDAVRAERVAHSLRVLDDLPDPPQWQIDALDPDPRRGDELADYRAADEVWGRP